MSILLNANFASSAVRLADDSYTSVAPPTGFASVPPEVIGEILAKSLSGKKVGALNSVRRVCKALEIATDPRKNNKVYPLIVQTIDPKFTKQTVEELKNQIDSTELLCKKKLAEKYRNSTKDRQCFTLKCVSTCGIGILTGGAIAFAFAFLILHLAFPPALIAAFSGALVCGLIFWLVSTMSSYTNIEKLSDDDAFKSHLKILPHNHCYKTYQKNYAHSKEESAIEKKLHFWFLRESKRLCEVTDCLAKIDAM